MSRGRDRPRGTGGRDFRGKGDESTELGRGVESLWDVGRGTWNLSTVRTHWVPGTEKTNQGNGVPTGVQDEGQTRWQFGERITTEGAVGERPPPRKEFPDHPYHYCPGFLSRVSTFRSVTPPGPPRQSFPSTGRGERSSVESDSWTRRPLSSPETTFRRKLEPKDKRRDPLTGLPDSKFDKVWSKRFDSRDTFLRPPPLLRPTSLLAGKGRVPWGIPIFTCMYTYSRPDDLRLG